MSRFVYDIPVKVYFGPDQLGKLAGELKQFGDRILLVYGGGSIKKSGLYDQVMDHLVSSGLQVFELSGIEPNPRIDSVRKGAEICKEEEIDLVLAVGGGSTIDASKFIAAGACVDHDPWEFFSKNKPIEQALPIASILTLAATGSEMDNIGVISNPETKEKLALGSPKILPKLAFMDPTNTYSVGQYQTASGSADILSHVFEVYFNTKEDLFLLDTFMEGIIKTVIKYAPIALDRPDNYEARANLMWASSWAINGFINGGKKQAWSCHPIDHELSAFYDITHGHGLAILTPRWLSYCLNEDTVDRYLQFAKNVFGIEGGEDKFETANQAIGRLEDFLYQDLGLKSSLSQLGIGDENFEAMAQKAVKGGTIKGFVPLNKEDVVKILQMSL